MSDPIVDPSKCPGTPELPRIEPLSIDCTVPEPPEPIREGRQIDTFAGSALNAVALLPNVTIVPPLPPGSNPPSSQVYPLVDCQGIRPTICAANNLSSYVGKVIRLDTCRQIQGPSSNLGQCSMLVLLNPASGEMFEDCQTCLSCWKLTMCGSPETALVTSQNLSAYEGRIVRLMDGFCYTVERTQNCVGALPVTIIADYNGCEDCGGCYVLTRCGGGDQRTVYNDLAGLVGTIPDEVVLGGYAFQIDGECWYASDFQPSCGGSGTETEIEAWYTNCGGCGCYHLVSISDSSVVVANAAVDENGSPINLSQHLGKVAKLEDGECYRIESSSDCGGAQEVTVVNIYGSNSPCQTCYELSPCDGGSNIITHSDLSLYQEGAVLKNRNDDSCWTLEGAVSCPGETVSFAASGPYSTCPDCQGVTKYRLTPSCQHEGCGGVGSSGGGHIVTTTDLRLAVGQYVNVGGTCYSVEVASSGAHVTDASVAYSGPFSSCGSCSSTPFTGRIWAPYEYDEDGVLMQQPRWIVVSGGLIVGTCLGDPAPLCVCDGASFSDSLGDSYPGESLSDSESFSESESFSDSESDSVSDSDTGSDSDSGGGDPGCFECNIPLAGKDGTVSLDVVAWEGTIDGGPTGTAEYLGVVNLPFIGPTPLWRCTKTFRCGEDSFNITIDFYCESGQWRTNIADQSVTYNGSGEFQSLSLDIADAAEVPFGACVSDGGPATMTVTWNFEECEPEPPCDDCAGTLLPRGNGSVSMEIIPGPELCTESWAIEILNGATAVYQGEGSAHWIATSPSGFHILELYCNGGQMRMKFTLAGVAAQDQPAMLVGGPENPGCWYAEFHSNLFDADPCADGRVSTYGVTICLGTCGGGGGGGE